jgi:predicted nuclease with RNAse H fold
MAVKKKAAPSTKKPTVAAAVAKGEIRHTNIRKLRERSRLTLEELAVLTGLDPTSVSKHQNAHRGIDEEALKRYARVFKCQSYELFVSPEVEDTYNGETWAVWSPTNAV